MHLHTLLPFLSSLAATGLLLSSAQAQSTTRISLDSQGAQGTRASYGTEISQDGRYVAFHSLAPLAPNDTNGRYDVYVHDRATGQVRRVSLKPDGTQVHADCWLGSLSADGRLVAFTSKANSLVPGDTNQNDDVFVRDLFTGHTERVSVASGGAQSQYGGQDGDLSADGRFVKFQSFSNDLGMNVVNGTTHVYVHDRLTRQTIRASVDSAGLPVADGGGGGCISGDGRFVGFISRDPNLVPGDANLGPDAFVHDRLTGITECVSVNSAGVLANYGGWVGTRGLSISDDGRYVSFQSDATNLVPNDTNGWSDIFVRDRLTGQTSIVSVDSAGIQGDLSSSVADISADGRRVIFCTASANLVPGDGNGVVDVFVHDRATGQTSRISVDSSGMEGNRDSITSAISADGRCVAFDSLSTNLVAGDTNGAADVFVRDTGPAPPQLVESGACPGSVTLTVVDATPGGAVALLHGLAGAFVKPGPPCQGLVLDLAAPALGAVLTADAAGVAVLSFTAPPGACGRSVQGVDQATCTATNVIVL